MDISDEKMHFLCIPVEVIQDNLLPFLKWNDLLRFRRVCKVTKAMTSAYIKVNPDLAPEIEINESPEKGFRTFLKLDIPTTRIYLDNISGDEFYEKNPKDITKFLKKYGPVIKHIRVKQFSLYCFGKEWDFLDSLLNLQSFEAAYFGIGKTDSYECKEELSQLIKLKMSNAKKDSRYVNDGIPNIFKQIRSLKFGQREEAVTIANITYIIFEYLKIGKGFEYIALPFNTCFVPAPLSTFTLPEDHDPRQSMALSFAYIMECIEEPETENIRGKTPNLKIIDFVNYHDEEGIDATEMNTFASQLFVQLCAVCNKYDVKLKNISPMWFQLRDRVPPQFASPEMGRNALSMIGLHPLCFPMNMPNLERIEIKATSRNSAGASWRREERPDWPSLKCLDITVDNKQTLCLETGDWASRSAFVDTKFLFNFLFKDIRRNNMTELRLNFTKPPGSVAVPKTEDIVASCPNLKKLEIVNWPGTNKALTKLWNGLPGLDEISLESCKELGNVAFVGEDTRSPVFLKLTKLKKLSLKGLDEMPKISDTLFSLVIRQLKLSHFTLSSGCPLKSVTPTGIHALLEGPFAKSIETFSFRGWSLMNEPSDEFSKLEQKFRSHDML